MKINLTKEQFNTMADTIANELTNKDIKEFQEGKPINEIIAGLESIVAEFTVLLMCLVDEEVEFFDGGTIVPKEFAAK